MVQEEMKLVLEEDSYQYIYLFWGSFERRSEKKKKNFEKKRRKGKSPPEIITTVDFLCDEISL